MKHARLTLLALVSLLAIAAGIAGGDLNAHLLPPSQMPSGEFLVTSEADAGPGSLRDAILAADRISTSATIRVQAKHISLETALPALVNSRGIAIDVPDDRGWIDADRLRQGTVLQIHSAQTHIKGLHIAHAHDTAVAISSPGVRLESMTVTDSKVAILLDAASSGTSIESATLERNQTGVLVEPGTHDLTVSGCTFRDSTRAGFWFVGPQDNGSGARGIAEHERARLLDSLFERNATGIVLANQSTLVQKSRFLGSLESAVMILGGAATLQDNDFRGSKGTAVMITAGSGVIFVHNTLADNAAAALIVRDSSATVERNTLVNNQLGIVSIAHSGSGAPVLRDNLISKTATDAVTLIGGTTVLERNQVLENHGAGLRELDLVEAQSTQKVTPRLEANVFKNNGSDNPILGVYKLAGPTP
jgi:hypothetical protein